MYRLLSLYSVDDFSQARVVLPRELKFLKHAGEYTVPLIKLLLTVLSVSRALRTKPSPSFKTITGPSEMKEYPFSPKDFEEFWSALGYTTKLKPGGGLDFKNYHKSSKSGPNGPAL